MASDTMQIDLDLLRNCFAEAHSERDELEQSIERSLENIQALQRRLCEWHADLCVGQKELQCQRESLTRQSEEAARQDQSLAEEISRLEKELAATQASMLEQSASDEQIERITQQQQDELQRLREECDQLARQRQNTEQELQSERETSRELRAALESAHDGITEELEARLQAINTELASTKGSLSERTEAIRDLEQERTALETELEMVRTRAAELTDALEAERKQIAQDRAEWSSELKQLRRLLERQARLATTPVANLQATPADAVDDDPKRSSAGGTKSPRREDPVVGSVLAQFDRIRQQRLAAQAAT